MSVSDLNTQPISMKLGHKNMQADLSHPFSRPDNKDKFSRKNNPFALENNLDIIKEETPAFKQNLAFEHRQAYTDVAKPHRGLGRTSRITSVSNTNFRDTERMIKYMKQ